MWTISSQDGAAKSIVLLLGGGGSVLSPSKRTQGGIWEKNLQGLKSWVWPPKSSAGFLLCETFCRTFIQNPKGSAEFLVESLGTRAPGKNLKDFLLGWFPGVLQEEKDHQGKFWEATCQGQKTAHYDHGAGWRFSVLLEGPFLGMPTVEENSPSKRPITSVLRSYHKGQGGGWT